MTYNQRESFFRRLLSFYTLYIAALTAGAALGRSGGDLIYDFGGGFRQYFTAAFVRNLPFFAALPPGNIKIGFVTAIIALASLGFLNGFSAAMALSLPSPAFALGVLPRLLSAAPILILMLSVSFGKRNAPCTAAGFALWGIRCIFLAATASCVQFAIFKIITLFY